MKDLYCIKDKNNFLIEYTKSHSIEQSIEIFSDDPYSLEEWQIWESYGFSIVKVKYIFIWYLFGIKILKEIK